MLELQALQVLSTVNCGWLWMIPAAPLAGALANGILAWRRPAPPPGRLASGIALAAAGLSFFLAFLAFLTFKDLPDNAVLAQNLLDWMEAPHLRFDAGLQLDDLSLVMVLFITWIAGWIHLYAAGSSDSGEGAARYLAVLNLTLFFLLALAMADGLFLMFLGWEGVGICAAYLIGAGAAEGPGPRAAQKTLAIHRLSAGAFLAGMLMVTVLAGTGDFNALQGLRQDFRGAAGWVCACFLVAALGKAAQFPLSTWLPGTFVGPVPGLALLYAVVLGATGVYLVARLHFLFVLAPWVTTAMALAGAVTALGAAFLSASQTQLKKILSYWTLSQVGLMFLALGVSAYTAGLFHLLAFGFFLPVLFLGAGSVIGLLQGEQDIRRMGGLLKQAPLTSLAFLLGGFSACGFPPFSGFFSANAVLWRALATPNPLVPWMPEALYGAGLLTAVLTAFSLTRLAALAFFGPEKTPKDLDPRELFRDPPKGQTLPLLILAVLSLGIGWIGVPSAIGGGDRLDKFLGSTFRLSTLEADGLSPSWQPLLMLAFSAAVLLGTAAAWYVFYLRPRASASLRQWMEQAGEAEAPWFGLDAFYEKVVAGGLRRAADWVCRRLLDEILLGGVARWVGKGGAGWTRALKRVHLGWAQFYFLYILAGAALLVYSAFH